MPTDQNSRTSVTRRLMVGTVTAAPLIAPVLAKPDGVTGDFRAWLQGDDRLESLTMEWSRAETDLFVSATQLGSRKTTNQMEQLEREIARIDRKRSDLLDRILTTPAESPEEAVGKLLVAKRLLEGEGGPEHDLVGDALTRFAAIYGLGH
mgnify:CR=1 FL=1